MILMLPVFFLASAAVRGSAAVVAGRDTAAFRSQRFFTDDLGILEQSWLPLKFEKTSNIDQDKDTGKKRDLQDDGGSGGGENSSLGMQTCLGNRDILEWRGFAVGHVCTCEASQDDPDSVILSCEANCQLCNAASSVCFVGGVISQTYDANTGKTLTSSQSVPYNKGRSETLVLTTNLTSEVTCIVTIDGEECNSCERVLCSDKTLGAEFNCGNIANISDTDDKQVDPVSTCDRTENRTGVMQFTNIDFQNGCEGDPPIIDTCQSFDDTVLVNFNCRCSPFLTDGGAYIADCLISLDFCIKTPFGCDILLTQAVFDPSFSLDQPAGTGLGYKSSQYNSSVSFIVPAGDDSSMDCIAVGNSQLCNTCAIVKCDSGLNPVIDCANVFPDIATQDRNQCDDNFYNGTPFEFLNSFLLGSPSMDTPISTPIIAPATAPVMVPVTIPISSLLDEPVTSPATLPVTLPTSGGTSPCRIVPLVLAISYSIVLG